MNIWFCRELKAESFGKKAQSERMKTEKYIDKIVRPPFILAHPLHYTLKIETIKIKFIEE